MKKLSFLLAFCLIISVALVGCKPKTTNVNEIPEQSEKTPQTENKSDKPFTIETTTFINKNTKINYPKITGFNDSNKESQINNLIKEDILKDYQKDIAYLVSNYYKTSKEAEDALTEDVNYYIKLNSPTLLSILYVKNGSIPGSAHPNNSVHSINIDIKSGTILKFKELINIDNTFVEKFKNIKGGMWTAKALSGLDKADEINKELPGAIESGVNVLQNRVLIDQFNKDDYSFYFTKDNFGLTSDVYHFLGDYAELEIKYIDIKDNIKSDNKIWENFINTKQQ